jgi:adenosylcobyric acid synthase
MSANGARAIMVLGSASDVGKSLVTAGLCRLFADAGIDVAPFKAQNMANQAGVTVDGLEMPRAQILQAHAAKQVPHVDMGPVLMKPVSNTGAEIIVLGKSIGEQSARAYFSDNRVIADVAMGALDRLAARHDLLLIEGAGSPVELNLLDRDFVNLRTARHAHAKIILVVDIDKGGVFAQAKGTLDLLPPEDRKNVVGLVVNRFRGDPTLFDDGITMLQDLCGVPVLALLPHTDHGLDEEDRPLRVALNESPKPGALHIGAILTPRTAITEDLAPLLAEPDVQLTWLTDPKLVLVQDLLVLPGSKATIGDLAHLTATGITTAIADAHKSGTWIFGICGGYQMLGGPLLDPEGLEGGARQWQGLGLLPISTIFNAVKRTTNSVFESCWPERGHTLGGFEIHRGHSHLESPEGEPLFAQAGAELGLVQGRVVGTYLHGVFTSDSWRAAFVNRVRRDRGLAEQTECHAQSIDVRIDRWARHLAAHLRPGAWERLLACAL